MLAAVVLSLPCTVLGQASFSESFDAVGSTPSGQDGPQALAAAGWIFRNQSNARVSTVWRQGTWLADSIVPNAGAGFLASNANWAAGNRNISTWAILPPIPGVRAGDTISYFISGWAYSDNRIQLRYSPSGGTNTGSNWEDVGDFTVLVNDTGVQPNTWTHVTASAPGSGRLAIRWYNPQVMTTQSPLVAIDTLTITASPIDPPIPQPGQTVTWRLQDSPIQVRSNTTIPAGGTVVIEPGVTVNFGNATLLVEGTLRGTATSASRITLSAAAVFPPAVIANGGTVDLTFADIRAQIRPGPGGAYLLTDCAFSGNGMIGSGDSTVSGNLAFFRLTRCSFTGSAASIVDAWSRLRDCTFTAGAVLSVLRGFPDIAACTSVGAPIHITREGAMQPLLVGPVTVTGAAAGAGLDLAGGDFVIAQGSTLQSNLYAVDLRGGLLPDSAVPPTGNTNNIIRVFDGGFAGFGRWSNFGLPYRLTHPASLLPGGQLTIDPGVVVEGQGPGTALIARSTRRIIAEGLPAAPITFRAVSPAQPWDGLAFITNASEGPRLEYADISGARIAVVASDSNCYVDNCAVHDNQTGLNANTFGLLYVRNCDLARNGVAMDITDLGGLAAGFPGNPNLIAGNTVGARGAGSVDGKHAEFNWWGSPSGPTSPLNPGGTGDSASGVQFSPFLTAAPPINHAPVVRLVEPGLRWHTPQPDPSTFFRPGDKAILRWTASDDDAIVEHRIMVSGDGPYLDRFVVVADHLPADIREYELSIPDVGFAISNGLQFIRVVATDSLGQEGFDDFPCVISSGRITGSFTFTNLAQFVGQTFIAGRPLPPIQYTGSATNFPIIEPFVVFESDGLLFGNGLLSTDSARLAIRARNNANDVEWWLAPGYFSIRPDPRMGYTPPAVSLTGPAPGSTFRGGQTVPITWTASATEGIRSFDVLVSTDGGRSFKVLIQDLPPQARSFDWRLPASAGIPDVRIRVVVRDQRFQNSCSRAASGDLVISVNPGQGCPVDWDRNGRVEPADAAAFVNAWFASLAAGTLVADFDRDGTVTPADVAAFVTAWFQALPGGC
jgi:hypothetical protein